LEEFKPEVSLSYDYNDFCNVHKELKKEMAPKRDKLIKREGAKMAKFPTDEWLEAIIDKLNTDDHYAQVAHKWEGDMLVLVEPGDTLAEPKLVYLDLWHGKCRSGAFMPLDSNPPQAVVSLTLPYANAKRLLGGELDVMQALLTRKIGVKGNMAILMRNIPTVLDFVRCAREVTDSFV
jgi:putative sterol carrier protein